MSLQLTVITIVKDELDGFMTTLNSVKSQNDVSFNWLVVDGSQSQTRDQIKELTLISNSYRYAYQEPMGIYTAMNFGLMLAADSWILFLNAGDSFVDADSTNRLRSILISSDQGVQAHGFGVQHVLPTGDIWETTFPMVSETCVPSYKTAQINHQGFVCKKAELLKYNGFDESLKFAADGKLMDLIVSNEKVELHRLLLTNFQLGGRSGKNYRELNWEITSYRPNSIASAEKPKPFKNHIRILIIELLTRFPYLAKPIIRFRNFL
jgi:glycosyltransferase involved in cell wall biosynthesis